MQEKNLLFIWSKTLLSAYRYLDTVTSAIDNLVLKQGVNSGYYYSGYYNSTYSCANKIIELTDRKQKLLSVRLLIDDALAKMQPDDIRLIVLYYFDMLKCSDVANALDISLRTFFRRKNIAINKFAKTLLFMGYDQEKLFAHLKNEGWLINLFNKNEKSTSDNEQESLDEVKEYKLLKYILKDLNKTTSKHYAIR